jgi:hypothetical protein
LEIGNGEDFLFGLIVGGSGVSGRAQGRAEVFFFGLEFGRFVAEASSVGFEELEAGVEGGGVDFLLFGHQYREIS